MLLDEDVVVVVVFVVVVVVVFVHWMRDSLFKVYGLPK